MSGRCGFRISGRSTRIFGNAVQTAVVRAVNSAGCFTGYPGPQSCVSFDPVYNIFRKVQRVGI
jgi:hypothetical protein